MCKVVLGTIELFWGHPIVAIGPVAEPLEELWNQTPTDLVNQ